MDLNDLAQMIEQLSPEDRAEVVSMAQSVQERFIPNPGRQTEAYYSEAGSPS